MYCLFIHRQYVLKQVSISRLNEYDLLQYEKEILGLILSHCHYDLKKGEPHSMEYNYQAIENDIIRSYVRGKPIITVDIPQVVYRTGVHSVATFESVRNQVQGQVSSFNNTNLAVFNALFVFTISVYQLFRYIENTYQ